jgi:hypothetical protein
MADEDDGVAVAREFDRFQVNLGDQRAGGVDDLQVPVRRLAPDLGRDAVGAEDRPRAVGDLVELFDEDGALAAQAVHDVLVVNDLLTDVNRRAEGLERDLDHVDRPDHSRAESAGLQKKDLFVQPIIRSEWLEGHS